MPITCYGCGKLLVCVEGTMKITLQNIQHSHAQPEILVTCNTCGDAIKAFLQTRPENLGKPMTHYCGQLPPDSTPPVATVDPPPPPATIIQVPPNLPLQALLDATKKHNLDRNEAIKNQAPQKDVGNTQKEEPVDATFEQMLKENGMI